MNVEGKKVLVTGAGRGLGRALAAACARAGAAEVVAGIRAPEAAAGLRADMEGTGARLVPLPLDVTRPEQVEEAARRTGPVDVLINNAGLAAGGGVFRAPLEKIREEWEVNVLGILRVVRAFAPAMTERGAGLIVNVASQLGRVNLPALGTYCASKAAVLSLTRALHADLAARGVRALAVCPGTLDTDAARGLDVPKMSPAAAAAEILAAIETEAPVTPIGEEARGLFRRLDADPEGVQQEMNSFRA